MTLELRPLDEADAQAIVSARCPEGYGCPPDFPAEGDRVAAGLFLERCAVGADPRPFGAFAVCLVPDDTASRADPQCAALIVGGIGFHGPPGDDGRVEIGYAIVPSHRGRGLATQALRRLVEHARELGAATLTAETDSDNEPSQAVLDNVGFVRIAQDGRMVWFELALARQ